MTRSQLWGRLLKKAREEAGLTQQELADRVGVEQPSVARWEAGRPIADHYKEVIAPAVGKTPAELFPWVSVG